jgi:hypothetical protein
VGETGGVVFGRLAFGRHQGTKRPNIRYSLIPVPYSLTYNNLTRFLTIHSPIRQPLITARHHQLFHNG